LRLTAAAERWPVGFQGIDLTQEFLLSRLVNEAAADIGLFQRAW
jgi:hypothetical protein